ncbi:MAG: glycosyltransferase family 2 protein [Chloroflexi bacterium]|nr:glycosyltransferase family 2 protein [Chloroflexota bacterium]
MKLSVIMPAYNEKDTILTALERVKAVEIEKEIIIVDNCSTDGTRELLQQINDDDIPSTGSGHCRIIFQPQNLGKGTSIRTAIPYCTGDYTIIQDADLEYDPQDWHKLVDLALEKHLDAVYGSRVLGGPKAIYTHYYWGVSFLTFLINLLFGAKLTDAATACKMIRTTVLKELKLTCAGFDLDFELTDKLLKKGYQIVEVPVSYRPRSFEEGKKIRAKDGLKALFTILRDRFWA